MARVKGVAPPVKPRTCAEFLDEWQPRIRKSVSDAIEIDFSWKDDAITITDMRIPSALRTGILYSRKEVEDRVDIVNPGDLNRRVQQFMSQAVGLK